jgi:hypothetical protein
MTSYQSLLDDAIALVGADMGFIVLRDSAIGTLRYETTYNFDPTEHSYSGKMFLYLLSEAEPRLTHNGMALKYLLPNMPSDPNLRPVIIVPLKARKVAYGLIWCERDMKIGSFTNEDLAEIIDLVDQFHDLS